MINKRRKIVYEQADMRTKVIVRKKGWFLEFCALEQSSPRAIIETPNGALRALPIHIVYFENWHDDEVDSND